MYTHDPSAHTASSSTLLTNHNDSGKLDDDFATTMEPSRTPYHHQQRHTTSLSSRTRSLPPNRLSANGFVEPHHSHLPRRRRATVHKRAVPPPVEIIALEDEDDAVDGGNQSGDRWGQDKPIATAPARLDTSSTPERGRSPVAVQRSSLKTKEDTNTTEHATSRDGAPADVAAPLPTTVTSALDALALDSSIPSPQFALPRIASLARSEDNEPGLMSLTISHPPAPAHVLSPPASNGPTMANLPRRTRTRGRDGVAPRRHVRRYVLDDGVDGDAEERKKSAEEMEDENVSSARADDLKANSSPSGDDTRCLQLLRVAGKEILIGFFDVSDSFMRVSGTNALGAPVLEYDMANPIVIIESEDKEVRQSISLSPEVAQDDLREGRSFLSDDQLADACRFLNTVPGVPRVWGRRDRPEGAFSVALAFLSFFHQQKEAHGLPRSPLSESTSSLPSSPGATTSTRLRRPNTLPTLESITVELDIESDLPVPDNYLYSGTHRLVMEWLDVGGWQPRSGGYLVPRSGSPPSGEETRIGPFETEAEAIECLRGFCGMRDEWRGVLSYEGLEKVDRVVQSLTL